VVTSIGRFVALVILFTSAVAAAQAPPIIPQKDRRFDHTQHDKILHDANKSANCATCHRVDPATGKKQGRDHLRCDNSGCHNLDVAERSCDAVKVSGPKSPARECQICHVPTNKRCLPADLPAKPTEATFTAHFAHNRHMGLGESAKSTCVDCHEKEEAGLGPAAPSEPHDACSGCHNGRGAKIAMNQCNECHVDKANAQVATRDDFTLIPFDHGKHNTKANLGAECLTCHKGIDAATAQNEWQMPKPAMKTCLDNCHDGKKAFSAVGTTCTRCHKGNGTSPAAPMTNNNQAFSHVAHRDSHHANMDDCASCHTVEKDGKVGAPNVGKDHMPCASSGCHQQEFLSRTPKICAACHDKEAPWEKTTSRFPGVQKSEFFGAINHKAHISIGGQCAQCHGNKLVDAPGPKEHEGCATGGKCHGGNQAPAMTDCKLCHKNQAAPRAAEGEWSVAATFKHSIHATDPRKKSQTDCALCHAAVPQATDLASLKLPEMKLCDSCHDGKTQANGKVIFKTTGFECARCHAKPQPPAATEPPPANAGSAAPPTSMLLRVPTGVIISMLEVSR
jgi:c(7)-type cytochrome triheme protein